ncbi:hypothetical protein OIV19_21715 [Brucella sp. HL-2]|nr:hypothetical protein [Brucella sp. HL-2]MCV9910215.1 hypothetical protein [Brucella sp. HL-2]
MTSANENQPPKQMIFATCAFDTSEALHGITRSGPVSGELIDVAYALCNSVYDLCKREAGDEVRETMVMTVAIVGLPAPDVAISGMVSGSADKPVQLMWSLREKLNADLLEENARLAETAECGNVR